MDWTSSLPLLNTVFSMTKLVIILDAWKPLVGGGQKLFWEIATGLVKNHDYQVTIIARALVDDRGTPYTKNETFLNGKLKVVRLGPSAQFHNLVARIWFTFLAVPAALKIRPDLFMASTFLPGLTLQLIKLFSEKPNVLVAIGFGAAKSWQWLEKLITQICRYDLVISDDRQFFNLINDSCPAKYIVNGVDIPKALLSRKSKKFTYLFVGRNEPRKGVGVLKQAFKKVKKKYPGSRLQLIGPGFKTVSQKKLDKIMWQSHCLVLPSLWEGHPLVLFEAWAHRLPVIATQVGSVPRFVNDQNGYLVPAGDVSALAKAMIAAYQNKNLAKLGENGFAMVKDKFTWKKTVQSYAQALTSLRQ
jgi:glycosyltransferase involved in cell wall biosynthesis